MHGGVTVLDATAEALWRFCCLQSERLHFVHIYNGRHLREPDKSAATDLS